MVWLQCHITFVSFLEFEENNNVIYWTSLKTLDFLSACNCILSPCEWSKKLKNLTLILFPSSVPTFLLQVILGVLDDLQKTNGAEEIDNPRNVLRIWHLQFLMFTGFLGVKLLHTLKKNCKILSYFPLKHN